MYIEPFNRWYSPHISDLIIIKSVRVYKRAVGKKERKKYPDG